MRSQTLVKLQEEREAVLCDYTLRKVRPQQQQLSPVHAATEHATKAANAGTVTAQA
jgi:hypothetical protein